MLLSALLVCLTIFALGLGLLTQRSLAYREAVGLAATLQALELARAGLEDARSKLDHDSGFPLVNGDDQEAFSYTEEVTDSVTGQVVGRYRVEIDLRYRNPPAQLLRIHSLGLAGPGAVPAARRRLTAELDVAPRLRTDEGQVNPDFFRYLQAVDEGAP